MFFKDEALSDCLCAFQLLCITALWVALTAADVIQLTINTAVCGVVALRLAVCTHGPAVSQSSSPVLPLSSTA